MPQHVSPQVVPRARVSGPDSSALRAIALGVVAVDALLMCEPGNSVILRQTRTRKFGKRCPTELCASGENSKTLDLTVARTPAMRNNTCMDPGVAATTLEPIGKVQKIEYGPGSRAFKLYPEARTRSVSLGSTKCRNPPCMQARTAIFALACSQPSCKASPWLCFSLITAERPSAPVPTLRGSNFQGLFPGPLAFEDGTSWRHFAIPLNSASHCALATHPLPWIALRRAIAHASSSDPAHCSSQISFGLCRFSMA